MYLFKLCIIIIMKTLSFIDDRLNDHRSLVHHVKAYVQTVDVTSINKPVYHFNTNKW